jgi:RNA polymerase sigma factor (sigma-70 family)
MSVIGVPSTEPLRDGPRCAGPFDLRETIASAAEGDQDAWAELIHRFSPVVWREARRFRLSRTDSEDVSQSVWMLAFQHLGRIRNPRAFPGWISTIARNEALRLVRADRRIDLVDPTDYFAPRANHDDTGVDHTLLMAERIRTLREGLATMPPEQRRLLLLLYADPRPSYQEVGRQLGIPTGSIGPTRARCLDRLRRTRAVRVLVQSEYNLDDGKTA